MLLAIIGHEVAHGWVAFKRGDPTAYRAGRLTFNPLNHIDPVGTVILPIITFMLAHIIFGWAKPVPVDFNQLKNPRRDMALVSLAGPGANLLMAIGWGFIAKLGMLLGESFPPTVFFIYMGNAGIFINCVLLVLNLLPILPLDGGRVLHSLLPADKATIFSQLEPLGIPILVILLFSGALNSILFPLVILLYTLLGGSLLVLQAML